jgi:hypothetical protein
MQSKSKSNCGVLEEAVEGAVVKLEQMGRVEQEEEEVFLI